MERVRECYAPAGQVCGDNGAFVLFTATEYTPTSWTPDLVACDAPSHFDAKPTNVAGLSGGQHGDHLDMH